MTSSRTRMIERVRVLFAIPELGSGGPDRVFFELLCGLDRNAFQPVLLVTKAGGRYFESLPRDVETCVIGGGRYPAWRFARAVDRLRPDVVLTTLRMNTTASAARIFQRHRPPLICRQANAIGSNFKELRRRSRLKYGFAEWAMKKLLRIPDALVAQSSDMGVELARDASPAQKIAVIGNPVSTDDVMRACVEQSARVARTRFGNPALVAVGRLTPQKGFDLLLEAFAQVQREYKDAGLTILGDGPDRAQLEADAERLGIAEKLRLPGHSDCVLAEVAAADIFVSSSRYEGFSNAILEAMALGTPVVATACEGGTRDMVVDGQTGILAGAVSADALVEALQHALRMDLGSLGQAGREHVGSTFSRGTILEEYAALFREVLGQGDDLTDPSHQSRKQIQP